MKGIMEIITRIVKAWIVGEDKKEGESKPFVPLVTWPDGTERYSNGPFFPAGSR